jgi:hypothetical protein
MRVFGLLFLLLSFEALAGLELTTQIHDIDYGHSAQDEVLVFLTSGQVAKLRGSHPILNSRFMSSPYRNGWFRVRLDGDRMIRELSPVKELLPEVAAGAALEAPMSYVPTTVASVDVAQRYHRNARYNPKESQCFNRAHVWAYEWWRNHSLRSMKILIYFTRTYIRRYNFEWWFHIAPYVHVKENGKVVERVLDVKYTRGPRKFQDWANIFLRNDAHCPVITKYSEYADNPYTGECYFQRAHMYTYQPADLQMNEAWGYEKTNWNMTEVRQAYLEAFDENL